MNKNQLQEMLHKDRSLDLEVLRDDLVEQAEKDGNNAEVFDLADMVQDEIEIRKYGRVVSDGSVSEL